MNIAYIFILAAAVLFLGFFGELIFRKTKIPEAILLILFGIIIGRLANWIDPKNFQSFIIIFTTFALVFIAFEGALHLNMQKLTKEFGRGTLLTFLNLTLSIAVVTIIAKLSGWSWINSLLLGVVLGSISSEIVIPMIKNLGLRESSALSLTVESAIGDVICVLGALTIIKLIKIGSFSWASFLNSFLVYFLLSFITGIVLGIIWIIIVKKFEHISKSYMTTIAFIALIFGAVELIKLDGAIACLSFGLVLGNSKLLFSIIKKENYVFEVAPNQKFFFSQITFFVETFFFVYLGIVMSFASAKIIFIGIIITIALFFVRPLAVYIAFRKDVISKDRALLESIVPRGLSAAVLAQIPLQYGIKGTEDFSAIALIVIFLSIVISTIMVFAIRRNWFRGVGSVYSELYSKSNRNLKGFKKDFKRE